MRIKLLSVMILVLSLTGCATVKKETKDMQIQQLQMQISKLRNELQQKNEKIDSLEWQLTETRSQKVTSIKEGKVDKSGSDTIRMTPKNIQVALKNAGFYNGSIDGKIGTGTKKAISEFQKANGLSADGIVGKKTWLKLKRYLY